MAPSPVGEDAVADGAHGRSTGSIGAKQGAGLCSISMRRLLVTIILLASGTAFAATTVYRWVDEQGVVHFSDQPHPGAQKLRVEDAPTFAAPPAPRTAARGSESGQPPADHPACAIESPSDQQMLMNV